MENREKHIENYQKLLDIITQNIDIKELWGNINPKNKFVLKVKDFYSNQIEVIVFQYRTRKNGLRPFAVYNYLNQIHSHILSSLNIKYYITIREHIIIDLMDEE
jgi:hypothetical protein